MRLLEKFKKAFRNPRIIFMYCFSNINFKFIPDTLFIKIEYFLYTNKKLNLKNPKSYNEKLQWLKIYDRNPKYINLVDKYEVRKHIEATIGEKYLIPLLGIYEKFDDIDFGELPNQFVLKPNHTSGNIYICKDKTKINYPKLRREINRWLKRNYYWAHREWPYKTIKPKIICEKYMVDESGIELKDYKFFCFEGKSKVMFIATDRAFDTKFDFFDMNFNHLPFMQHYLNSNKFIQKPKGFEKMKNMAELLSINIPHVRVDFYDINGEIFFGEFTLYHFSGLEIFTPEKYDLEFGSWLNIP